MTTPLSINEKPYGTGPKDATNHITHILLQQRFDIGPALFDESLALVKERKYTAAAERLRMLRCLDPSHTAGIILLSKVLARLDKWDEANDILNVAVQQKLNIPRNLRAAILENQKRYRAKESQEQLHSIQKLKDQLKKSRIDLKKADQENSQNHLKITVLERSLQKWSRACALVTGVTIALLFVSWQIDSGTSNAAAVDGTGFNDSELPIVTPPSAEVIEPQVEEAPAGAQAPPVQEEPEPEPVQVEPEPEPEPEPVPEVTRAPTFPKTHVVRSGDTLSEIAEKYYRRQSLGSWLGEKNNTSAQTLQVGQELLIPSPPEE